MMIHSQPPYPLAPLPEPQTAGRVTHLFPDGTLTVECAERGWHCRRAASCLLVPAVGDTVLLASLHQQVWLLAILERVAPQQMAELRSDSPLHIVAQDRLRFSSQHLSLHAEEGECHIDNLHYSGASLSAWISISSVMGKRCESVWQTISQISDNVFRKIRQSEQLRVGQLDVKAENYLHLHGQNTVISAKAIAKVDAGQVHIG